MICVRSARSVARTKSEKEGDQMDLRKTMVAAILLAVPSFTGVAHAEPPFDFGYTCTSVRWSHTWYNNWSCVEQPVARTGALASYVMGDSLPRAEGLVYCPDGCPIPDLPRGVAARSLTGNFHDGSAGTRIRATAHIVGWGCLSIYRSTSIVPGPSWPDPMLAPSVCGEGDLAATSDLLEFDVHARVSVVGTGVVTDLSSESVAPSTDG